MQAVGFDSDLPLSITPDIDDQGGEPEVVGVVSEANHADHIQALPGRFWVPWRSLCVTPTSQRWSQSPSNLRFILLTVIIDIDLFSVY